MCLGYSRWAGRIRFLSCSPACTWPWPRPSFSSSEPTPCDAWCSPAAGLQAARMRWAPGWSECAEGVGDICGCGRQGKKDTAEQVSIFQLPKLGGYGRFGSKMTVLITGTAGRVSMPLSCPSAASPLLVPLSALTLQLLWGLDSFF